MGEDYSPLRVFDAPALASGNSPNPSTSSAAGAWLPIESAPRDGRHVLVAIFGPGSGVGFGRTAGMDHDQPWMDVAHWYGWAEGGHEFGFYSSSWGGDQEEPFRRLTHWMPLPPGPTERDSEPLTMSMFLTRADLEAARAERDEPQATTDGQKQAASEASEHN